MLKTLLSHLVLAAGIIVSPMLVKAQNPSPYEKRVYQNKTDTLQYRVLMPENFDPTKKYALIVILHGSGERGSDNEAQLKYGKDLFLKPDVRQQYQSIVIFPQCPKNTSWANTVTTRDSTGVKFSFPLDSKPTPAMRGLMGMINDYLDKPYVNKQRVYIGGLSMGGMGTFEIISRMPNVFAAALPMCGAGNPENATKFAKKVPLWVFHGAKDTNVPIIHSQMMVDAVKAAGGDPKFTIYPNDSHDCWDDAFAEPQLIPWLFSHTK